MPEFQYPHQQRVDLPASRENDLALEEFLNTILGQHGAKMERITSDQSIGISTNTTIDWNSTAWDTDGLADPANNRFVIPDGLDGLWRAGVHIEWGPNNPNQARVEAQVNGTLIDFMVREWTGATYNGLGGHLTLDLVAGDLVTFIVWYQTAAVIRAGFSFCEIVRC